MWVREEINRIRIRTARKPESDPKPKKKNWVPLAGINWIKIRSARNPDPDQTLKKKIKKMDLDPKPGKKTDPIGKKPGFYP